MATTIRVRDESPAGATLHDFRLDFLTEQITVRELIERRVREEVDEYNRARPALFRGLVQPTDAEASLNGYVMRERHPIDYEAQRRHALDAFRRNGFFILIDDRQVASLDERITIGLGTEVSFVKLVPLIGG